MGPRGSTSHPKEGVLRIFIALKNQSLQPGLNPRTLGPVTCTLTTTPLTRLTSLLVLSAIDEGQGHKGKLHSKEEILKMSVAHQISLFSPCCRLCWSRSDTLCYFRWYHRVFMCYVLFWLTGVFRLIVWSMTGRPICHIWISSLLRAIAYDASRQSELSSQFVHTAAKYQDIIITTPIVMADWLAFLFLEAQNLLGCTAVFLIWCRRTHLWNVGRHPIKNTAVHPRRFWASYSPPWQLEISHSFLIR
jgi:hypothetical protein